MIGLFNRRALLPLVAAALMPRGARAQTTTTIELLGSASPGEWTRRIAAFKEGLKEAGHIEGANLVIDYRWAENRNERLPALAEELVQRRPKVIAVLGNTVSALAAKKSTSAIPIVFRIAGNPVEIGLVASLARPGGNVTGITTLGIDLVPKQFELLSEIAPAARSFGLLVNPTNAINAEAQARSLAALVGRDRLRIAQVQRVEEFEAAFASLRQSGTDALIIGADTFLNIRSPELAALAGRHGMPTISPYREFVEAGGLMSYGGSILGASRQAGVYVGRILNGERPENLPVQQVVSIELLVNLGAARRLGLAPPTSLLARADEVIE
jgi:putative ABC transport system substrate-binding protein